MQVTKNHPGGRWYISGILAGFTLLAKRGELTLRVQDERQGSPLAREALLETEIDGRTVVFDLMDGYLQRPCGGAGAVPPGRCGVQTQLQRRRTGSSRTISPQNCGHWG